ncbi:MAG TPA: hypothetical protein PK620_15520 [Denitromonas sp.]|nr:hypothetical protein [Denitromonas sp.]
MVTPDCSGTATPVAGTLGRPRFFLIAVLAVAACTAPTKQAAEGSPGFIEELPEQVALLAAPYQNLQEVTLKPEDGCYWYRHVGPVETTMLPLRTVEGRPICRAVKGKAAAAG